MRRSFSPEPKDPPKKATPPPGHSYHPRARGGWEASFPWAEPPLRLAIVTSDARWRAGTAIYYLIFSAEIPRQTIMHYELCIMHYELAQLSPQQLIAQRRRKSIVMRREQIHYVRSGLDHKVAPFFHRHAVSIHAQTISPRAR